MGIRLQRLLLIFIGLIYQPAVDLAEQKSYILWANAAMSTICSGCVCLRLKSK
jgi:hypothetical protein